ncbi:P-loop containing nucleoside triphosphate hydrolase protein, partial [Dichomitus squalens LYAD-421 SS1]
MSKQSKSKDPSSKGRAVGQAVVELFDKMSLHGDAAVDIAVVKLDHLLADPSIDIDEVVELMTSVQHLLEFVLCVSSDYGFGILSIAILQRQPSTAEDYPSSLLYKLLAQLSRSLCLPYERASDTPPVLSAHRRSIELAFSVLQAVTHLNATDALAEQMGDELGSGRWAAKNEEKRHQKRKRSIHTGRAPPVDIVKSIIQYGAPVPTSKRQAAELVTTVVAEQTSILQEVFNMFRKEETIAFFKTTYLPIPPAPTPLTVTIPTQRTRSATTALTPFVPMTAWRIQMSTRADRDLRRWRNEDAKMFDIIVNKIKDLSHGNFTKDNHKKLTGVEVDIPIYEAKMTRDSRLVYHIHCDIDFEDNVERQVIRIFGVYTHAQIDGRFWDTMGRQLGYNGPEYRRRCIFRDRPSNQRGDYTVLPASFEVRSDTEQEVVTPSSSTTDHPDLTREDKEELHSLIALEKFVTFSQAFLNSILADQDVAHVFGVSHREKEIIEHDSSCFVIGRSGTGKTTTMVFKILGIERTYDTGSFRYAMAKPRQLFVTQSQVLAKKVEEYYAKLHQSYATAHLSPDELLEIASQSRTRRERMVDEDEEIFYTSTLPRRFGALEDTHFPLFLTYNHLCRLLENEFRHLVEQEKIDAHRASLLRDIMKLRPRPTRTRPAAYLQEERDTFLDYDTFREIYWSHFPENPLNPDLVWGEFVAVIKGSAGALKSDLGYLDKETYVGHGHSRSQTVSPAQRETVYALFEVYTKRRKLHGHHDPADRTRMLIRCLKAAGVPGKALNFIYVDEAQDNFLIDSLVLKALCSNPHGLFWAGDTAQTIAAGSSFRLGDLKAQLYDVEKNPLSISKRARPQTFYLTRNYRSHSGIVDCAHSIVELITNYWSTAIDDLPRERGMSPGEKPIFFSDHDAAKLQQSLFRDVSGGGVIEFGARQCIIVRDHAARDRLKSEFGKIGQVLTIYESKGLEFDDVLLYNFFEDSSMNYSQWRVLLNSIPGHPAPNYDDGRHSGICRELKHLYVAITRARQNLWITDCSQKAEPLRLLWATKGVVEEHIPGTPIPKLAKSSRKEEWANAARSLFVKRQYSEAVDAFERAGLAQERRVALAYHLRDSARMSPVNARGKELSQSAAFSRAAEGFVAAAQGAGEPEDQRTYYRIAAECYVRCGDSGKAGAAYRHAGEYTLSAQHFRKAGMFDDAVEVIQVHETDVRPDVAQSIIDVSKLYYIKENKLEKARALFEDDEEAFEYMNDRDLNAPRATLHEEREEFDDAAECHLREGNNLKAIELFLLNYQRHQSSHSLLRAATCVLNGLWLYLALWAPEDNWNDETIIILLEHAEVIAPELQDDDLRNEIAMFRALWQSDFATLAHLGELFHARQEHHPAALLCLDHVFAQDFGLASATLSEIALCFQRFLIYARSLSRFSCDPNPCSNPYIQKLFAFRRLNDDSEELFFLPKVSYLYIPAQKILRVEEDTPNFEIHISRWELERLIRAALREVLRDKVWSQNEMCHTMPGLRTCLLFASTQSCPRRQCSQLHIMEAPQEA